MKPTFAFVLILLLSSFQFIYGQKINTEYAAKHDKVALRYSPSAKANVYKFLNQGGRVFVYQKHNDLWYSIKQDGEWYFALIEDLDSPERVPNKNPNSILQNYPVDKFKLTSDGFINDKDESRSFIVINIPNTDQKTLYQKALKYINKNYVSPKDVMSLIENESITVNGFAPRSIYRNKLGHVFDMNYTINFEFKDNKIKVEKPSFRLTTFTQSHQRLLLVHDGTLDGSILGIFNTAGELKSKLAKNDLETHFNTLIQSFANTLSSPETDW
ncbi:DUF4468 domain-containing protein [Adhaeribacter aquaticus]|uniref:DUF4468 domain-containing protein n=1 Tax=Adhaeribacter aquaticus TaxID=299567 RepID=UPI0004070006|nr:DUF4468 domain-containing protein [Adhaeribacter aquaticus]